MSPASIYSFLLMIQLWASDIDWLSLGHTLVLCGCGMHSAFSALLCSPTHPPTALFSLSSVSLAGRASRVPSLPASFRYVSSYLVGSLYCTFITMCSNLALLHFWLLLCSSVLCSQAGNPSNFWVSTWYEVQGVYGGALGWETLQGSVRALVWSSRWLWLNQWNSQTPLPLI